LKGEFSLLLERGIVLTYFSAPKHVLKHQQ